MKITLDNILTILIVAGALIYAVTGALEITPQMESFILTVLILIFGEVRTK